MSNNRVNEGSALHDAMAILARIIVRAYDRNAALARYFESPFFIPECGGVRVYAVMTKRFRWFSRDEEGKTRLVTLTLCG
jgi:hypothetical protein